MFFGMGVRGFCGLVAVFGLWGAVDNWSQVRDDKAFDKRGKHAFAQPIDHVQETTYKKHGQTTGVSYHADLTFTTEAGQSVTAKSMTVNEAQFDQLRTGRLELVYLPEKPTKVRFPDWTPASSSTTGGAFLLFLAGAAGFWLAPRKRG